LSFSPISPFRPEFPNPLPSPGEKGREEEIKIKIKIKRKKKENEERERERERKKRGKAGWRHFAPRPNHHHAPRAPICRVAFFSKAAV
jgi:hypothetical protein